MKQQAIDKTKVIEIIGNVFEDLMSGKEVRLGDVIDKIHELEALGDGWIESSTKPEEGFYLTYNTIGAIFETYYHPHTGWCTGGSIKETEITHYQPLINPPNK